MRENQFIPVEYWCRLSPDDAANELKQAATNRDVLSEIFIQEIAPTIRGCEVKVLATPFAIRELNAGLRIRQNHGP